MTARIEVKALDYGQAMEHSTGVPVISPADGLIGMRVDGTDKDTGKGQSLVVTMTPSEAVDLAIALAKAVTVQRDKYTPPAGADQ